MSFPRHGEQAVNPVASAQMYDLYIFTMARMCNSYILSSRATDRAIR